MAGIGEMLAVLGINTAPFTAGMAKAKGEMSGFADTANKSSNIASSAFHAVAIAAVGVGVAAVGIGAASVTAAAKFQSSMELIRTQAGASQAEVAKMSAGILALAPQVGTGPDALATGLYHIESAGIRGAKALEILKVAAEGAKVGNADLESVTNALIASVNSGVKGVGSMTGAMGTLNAIVGSGNMRMQDLTDALGTGILSTAKAFGLSIQDVGGAIADMTNQGVPAIDAATRLRMTISLLGAPSTKAAKELATIGITSTQLATDMRTKGLLPALQDLQNHLTASGKSAVEQAQILSGAFGGGKSSSAILTLLGSLTKLGTIQTQITKGAGSFQSAWQATTEDLDFQWQKLVAFVQTGAIRIGDVLLPMVNNVISGINNWLSKNQGLISSVAATAGQIASFAGGALSRLASTLLPSLLSLLGDVASNVRQLVSSISNWASANQPLIAQVQQIGTEIGGAFLYGLRAVVRVFTDFGPLPALIGGVAVAVLVLNSAVLANPIVAAIAGIVVAIGLLVEAWNTDFGGIREKTAQVVNAIKPAFDSVVVAVKSVAQWVVDLFKRIASNHDVAVALQTVLQAIGAALAIMGNVLITVGKGIGQFFTWIVNDTPAVKLLQTAVQALVDVFQTLWQAAENVVGAIQKMLDLAGSAAKAVGSIPGVGLVGSAVGAVGKVGGGFAGAIAGIFQEGGVVPGTGPQLAIVHGGETIVPPYLSVVTAPSVPAIPNIASLSVQPAKGITGSVPPSAAATATAALAAKIKLQAAEDAVTNAHTALAKAEAEKVTKTRSASDIATQVAAAERRLLLAEEKLALLREQQALPASTTKGTTTGSSTANAQLTAALTAFTAALVRAVQSGVPITLDGQAIGDLVNTYGYTSAAMSTSGFVAQGSIG